MPAVVQVGAFQRLRRWDGNLNRRAQEWWRSRLFALILPPLSVLPDLGHDFVLVVYALVVFLFVLSAQNRVKDIAPL